MTKAMRRMRIVSLPLFCLVLLLIAVSSTSIPDFSSDCSQCHVNSAGMTLTVSAASIEVPSSEVFSLNVYAKSLVCKFPSTLANNSDFTFLNLNDEGFVRDGDSADLDPDEGEIAVHYNLSAPEISGSYTLWLFAVSHTPFSNSTRISVNVTARFAWMDILPLLAACGVILIPVLGMHLYQSRRKQILANS